MTGAEAVDAYLAGVGEPHRQTLEAVRATLRKVLPDADEAMKYGMPAFVVDGAGVAGYTVSKGGLQFPPDRPLPATVIEKLVELRLDELGAGKTGR